MIPGRTGAPAPVRSLPPPPPLVPVPGRRPRALYLLLVVPTIALGLASRRYAHALPSAIGAYAGDVLWAGVVFLLIALLRPSARTWRIAAGAAAFSLAIELSQLYHAPWIDAVRQTRLGGLVLGFGFLWTDLACYAMGIALAAALDRLVRPAAAGRSGTPAG